LVLSWCVNAVPLCRFWVPAALVDCGVLSVAVSHLDGGVIEVRCCLFPKRFVMSAFSKGD
jgi:hypothetical protein